MRNLNYSDMTKDINIFTKWREMSLVLRIVGGLIIGSCLGLLVPQWIFNIGSDVAMQAVAIGFIIGVIQDSLEAALNSSSDVFFTAAADYYDRKKRGDNKANS